MGRRGRQGRCVSFRRLRSRLAAGITGFELGIVREILLALFFLEQRAVRIEGAGNLGRASLVQSRV